MKKQMGFKILLVFALVLALVFEAFVPFKAVSAVEQFGNTVTVTASALKKAKANIKITLNGVQLKKKALSVKGKVNGKKESVFYIPSKEFVETMGGNFSAKGKKVTITGDNVKLTFTRGKNSYSVVVTDENGNKNKFTLKCGMSIKKSSQVYIPLEVIESLAVFTENLSDYEFDSKKKTLDLVIAPKEYFEGTITLTGAWGKPETPEVPEKVAQFFEQANKINKDDEQIIPVAVIEEQVVAGMNYKLLCRISNPSKNEAEVYAFVTVYSDLNGNVEVTSESKTAVETDINNLMGGWSQFENPTFPVEYLEIFNQAISQLDGVSYNPIAIVSSQVVAGMNLCILCEATVVYPGAQPYYVFVYVYVNPGTMTGEIKDFKKADIVSDDNPVSTDDNNNNQDSGNDDKGLKIPGSENAVAGVDYQQMSGNYYAVTSLAGLAKVCEMEVLPDGEFKTNIAGVRNDIIIDVPIETLGYVEVTNGATVTVEKGGILQASVEIAEGCKIIVKDGGKLQTTMGGELCFKNYGEIVVEKGGLLQSMFGGTINNYKTGKIFIDGDFYCGCVSYDGASHVWFKNDGTVVGNGKVSLYGRGMDGKADLDADYCMSEMKKMLGSNTGVTVVFDETIDF